MTQPKTNDDIFDALGNLQEAVGAGFDKVSEKLQEHDRRFDAIDARLTEVDGKLERIEQSILEDHARRLEALEKKVGLRA